MEISGLELVEHVLHPYPIPKQAIGIYVFGDNPGLAAQCALTMLETVYEDGMYTIDLRIMPEFEDEEISLSALDFANSALEMFDLPRLEELEPTGGLARDFEMLQIGTLDDCEVGIKITRARFEELYTRVAESDFVQLNDEPFVAYILDSSVKVERERLEKVLREVYPEACENNPHPEVSAVVNRYIELSGVVRHEPFEVFLFEGAVDGWDDSQLPHPYPPVKDAEGMYVDFGEGVLSESKGLGLFESTARPGAYELMIILNSCPHPAGSQEEIRWASFNADAALEMLSLPSYADLELREPGVYASSEDSPGEDASNEDETSEDDPNEDETTENEMCKNEMIGPDAGALSIFMIHEANRFVVKFELTRREFEGMFLQAASSDFVQLNGRGKVTYITRSAGVVNLEQARQSFQDFFTAMQSSLDEDEEMVQSEANGELRALLDVDRKLIGFAEPSLDNYLNAEDVF